MFVSSRSSRRMSMRCGCCRLDWLTSTRWLTTTSGWNLSKEFSEEMSSTGEPRKLRRWWSQHSLVSVKPSTNYRVHFSMYSNFVITTYLESFQWTCAWFIVRNNIQSINTGSIWKRTSDGYPEHWLNLFRRNLRHFLFLLMRHACGRHWLHVKNTWTSTFWTELNRTLLWSTYKMTAK